MEGARTPLQPARADRGDGRLDAVPRLRRPHGARCHRLTPGGLAAGRDVGGALRARLAHDQVSNRRGLRGPLLPRARARCCCCCRPGSCRCWPPPAWRSARSARCSISGVGRERVLFAIPDAWHAVGPALVLIIAGPLTAAPHVVVVYVVAFAAGCLLDLLSATLREAAAMGIASRVQFRVIALVWLIDASIAPFGLLVAHAARHDPAEVLLILPLNGVLLLLSRDRSARIEQAQRRLELVAHQRTRLQAAVQRLGDALRGEARPRGPHRHRPARLDRGARRRRRPAHAERPAGSARARGRVRRARLHRRCDAAAEATHADEQPCQLERERRMGAGAAVRLRERHRAGPRRAGGRARAIAPSATTRRR